MKFGGGGGELMNASRKELEEHKESMESGSML